MRVFLWFFWHTRGKLGWRLKAEDWRKSNEEESAFRSFSSATLHQSGPEDPHYSRPWTMTVGNGRDRILHSTHHFFNQPPRSKLSRYEMNVIISQQAAENERSSRLSGIQMVDRACPAFIKGLTMTNAVVRAFRRAYSGVHPALQSSMNYDCRERSRPFPTTITVESLIHLHFRLVIRRLFWYEFNHTYFPSRRNGGWNHVKIEGCEKRQQKETGQIPQREKRSQEVEKTGKSIKTGHRQWVIGDGTGAISEKWKAMSEGFVMVRQARHDT